MHVETITTTYPFHDGERIKLIGDTNRVRRRVKQKMSETQWEIETFTRPSRGYARHLRRHKALGR